MKKDYKKEIDILCTTLLLLETKEEAQEYFDVFKGYQSFHRLSQLYPPYFSKLIKHYTATYTIEGINRNRQVSEILKVTEKVTGYITDVSYQIMSELVEARPEKYQGQL